MENSHCCPVCVSVSYTPYTVALGRSPRFSIFHVFHLEEKKKSKTPPHTRCTGVMLGALSRATSGFSALSQPSIDAAARFSPLVFSFSVPVASPFFVPIGRSRPAVVAETTEPHCVACGHCLPRFWRLVLGWLPWTGLIEQQDGLPVCCHSVSPVTGSLENSAVRTLEAFLCPLHWHQFPPSSK